MDQPGEQAPDRRPPTGYQFFIAEKKAEVPAKAKRNELWAALSKEEQQVYNRKVLPQHVEYYTAKGDLAKARRASNKLTGRKSKRPRVDGGVAFGFAEKTDQRGKTYYHNEATGAASRTRVMPVADLLSATAANAAKSGAWRAFCKLKAGVYSENAGENKKRAAVAWRAMPAEEKRRFAEAAAAANQGGAGPGVDAALQPPAAAAPASAPAVLAAPAMAVLAALPAAEPAVPAPFAPTAPAPAPPALPKPAAPAAAQAVRVPLAQAELTLLTAAPEPELPKPAPPASLPELAAEVQPRSDAGFKVAAGGSGGTLRTAPRHAKPAAPAPSSSSSSSSSSDTSSSESTSSDDSDAEH